MTSRTRAAGLSNLPSRGTVSPHSSDSAGTRAFLVLVLTPALIFFMSRKEVGHAANRLETSHPASRTAALDEGWPSSGFSDIYSAAHPRWSATPTRFDDTRSANVIYSRAMLFARKYDSRPYWKYQKLEVGAPTDRGTADLAIEHLIPCESMGRSINRIDSNGKMSYGILQFQDWDEWEAASGLTGNPDNRRDAIRMAEWAIENGMVNHWTCAQILKIM